MSTHWPTTDLPDPVTVRAVGPRDRRTLERLWLLFSHEMTAYSGVLPNRDGRYRRERLVKAFEDPCWGGWLLTAADRPIGFAVVRALDRPVRVLSSFFLVAPARRLGLGTAFARSVVGRPHGAWSVPYQDANPAASRFWPRLAEQCDPGWTARRVPVPGRPDLPPDTWVTFRTAPPRTTPVRVG